MADMVKREHSMAPITENNLSRSFSVDEEEQYVCITIPDAEALIQRVLAHGANGLSTYGRLYLLCQTVKDIIPGFNLLETRMISQGVSGWPVVMATLYRQDTREGIVQHMKTMTRICSSAGEEFYSPKVSYVHLLFRRWVPWPSASLFASATRVVDVFLCLLILF